MTRRLVNVMDTDPPAPTRGELLSELKQLKSKLESSIDPFHVPSILERARTYQNVGGYMMRAGRMEALIRELEIPIVTDQK